MNSDDLDEMLSKFDTAECVRFFENMPEKERKSLAERALHWQEVSVAFEQVASPFVNSMWAFIDALPKRTRDQIALTEKVKSGEIKMPVAARDKRAIEISRLAATATAGLSDIRKMAFPSEIESAFSIMRNRHPKWLPRWLNFACEKEPHVVWQQVRQIELDVEPAERGEAYWLSMALTLGRKDAEQLLAYLRQDAEVLSHMIFPMLESEQAVRALSDPTGINDQLTPARRRDNFDMERWKHWGTRLAECRSASYIWKIVLGELSTQGELSRQKYLDIIFAWLTRVSADTESKASSSLASETSPAGWFQELHDELKLDQQTKLALAANYIGLLSVKDSSTLAFSIKNLMECPLKELPIEDLLVKLPRVFYHKKKEPALTAIKLIEKLHQDKVVPLNRLSELTLECFEHSSSEVQKKALSFLKKTKAIEDPQTLGSLNSRADRMSSLLKKEIMEIAAKSSGNQSKADDNSAAPDCSFTLELPDLDWSEIEALKLRVEALPETINRLAGLKESTNAIDDLSENSGRLFLESMEIPRLDPSQMIAPVKDIDELIFLCLHILEDISDADDVERLLDGMLRLCNVRPDDFENRVSSLRKKLEPVVELMNRVPASFFPFNGMNLRADLQALAIAWLDTGKKDSKGGLFNQVLKSLGFNNADNPQLPPIIESAMSVLRSTASPQLFFSQRVQELVRLVPKQRPLPLLSAPTHKGGWIDPLQFVKRIKQWLDVQQKFEKADLIQALLRLAPEHRLEALAILPNGSDEQMRAIRYALGDEMKAPINTAEIWVAAFRCRTPRENSEFLSSRFPELGPDSAKQATFIDSIDAFKSRREGVYGSWREQANMLPLESDPQFVFRPGIQYFPTELLHERDVLFELTSIPELYWPHNRESYYSLMTRRMAAYIDSQGNYWKTSWNSLFDPDFSLDGTASWLLVFALSAKQPEAARLALDAVIAGIDDDRLDAAGFGIKLGRAYCSEKITLSRWMVALKEIARISPLHLNFVHIALENFLAQLPLEQCFKPPIAILDLLYESCLSSKGSITNERTQKFLRAVSGKGKGAKLAALLLELPVGQNADFRRYVAVRILESRIQRAERWNSYSMSSHPQTVR